MGVFANGESTDGTYRKAMEGITIPHLFDIPRGTTLYRFVDITRGPHKIVANSSWWFEYEYFQKIKHFSEQHEYPLDYSARLFLAVLHEYSEITGYVSARVLKPLKAWKGEGKVQFSSGKDPRDSDRLIPMQSFNSVYQLYIPGLYRGSPLMDVAFGSIDYVRIK